MSNKQESNIPWWAIVLGFIFFWPAGMILLFLSLGGVSIPIDRMRQDYRQSYRPNSQYQYRPPTAQSGFAGQSGGQGAAQSGTAQGASQKTAQGAAQGTAQRPYSYGTAPAGQKKASPQGESNKKRFSRKPKSGKLLTALGGITSFVFGLGFASELIDALRYGFLSYADELFPIFGFFCAGLVMLWNGLGQTRFGRRQRLYMGVIGSRNSVFLSDLANAAGVSEKKVVSDLQRMLSDGTLPMGYIDRASGRLVLTDQGYEAPRPEAAPRRASEQPKEDEDNAILRQIKAVNDAIPDDEMSRKIDRIGEITGKILDYQRKNPAKAPELRQFLNYYLPTTLKILRAYAQMEAQGVEGENISAAKRRIEDMMDKVVEGFEKQLDQLFATDVMDIATDVEVLERMLDKDGLGSGMTLGG